MFLSLLHYLSLFIMISAASEGNLDWSVLRDPLARNVRLDEICQKKGYLIDMENVIFKVSGFEL